MRACWSPGMRPSAAPAIGTMANPTRVRTGATWCALFFVSHLRPTLLSLQCISITTFKTSESVGLETSNKMMGIRTGQPQQLHPVFHRSMIYPGCDHGSVPWEVCIASLSACFPMHYVCGRLSPSTGANMSSCGAGFFLFQCVKD